MVAKIPDSEYSMQLKGEGPCEAVKMEFNTGKKFFFQIIKSKICSEAAVCPM